MGIPKLFIHIGGGKTGSSALQSFFKKNTDQLKKQNIIYPFVQEYSQPFETSSGNANFIIHNEIDNSITELFDIASKGYSCILSSEMLYSPLYIESFKRFIDKIKEKFDVYIIVYIRRQDRLTESVNVQGIKNHKWTEFKKDIGGLPTYKSLSKFANLVGKNQFIVRVYEKEQFENNNIFDDFLKIIGIKNFNDFKKLDRPANPPMDRDFLELKRICNKLPFDENEINKYFTNAFWELSALDNYKPFSSHNILTLEERKEILKKYEKDNKEIAEKFLNRATGELFFEKIEEELDEPLGYKGLNPETIIKGFAFLHVKNQELILSLRKRLQSLDNTIISLVESKTNNKSTNKQTIENYHFKNITKNDFNEIYNALKHIIQKENCRNQIEEYCKLSNLLEKKGHYNLAYLFISKALSLMPNGKKIMQREEKLHEKLIGMPNMYLQILLLEKQLFLFEKNNQRKIAKKIHSLLVSYPFFKKVFKMLFKK